MDWAVKNQKIISLDKHKRGEKYTAATLYIKNKMIRRLLFKNLRQIILLGFIVLICIFVSLINSSFFTPNNILNIFKSINVYGILALGMMAVMSTGNIDVSIGPTMIATGGIAIKFFIIGSTGSTFSPLIAFLIAIAVGIIIGMINGFLVAYMRIHSLIATLGTYSVIRGLICILTEGRWITGFPQWYTSFAHTKVFGIYIGIIIWIFLIICTYLIFYRLNYGRKILVTGDNGIAASRAGINVRFIYMSVYIYLGILSGISSILFFSQNGIFDPLLGEGYEMTVIAAVIIGGTLLEGGSISIAGTVMGVFMLGLINSMLVFSHIPVYWQKLVTGLIILIAVVSSYTKSKKITGKKVIDIIKEKI